MKIGKLVDIIAEYINTSRKKLVDLSKRNKLINFNLETKRPRQLDIASATLSQLWKAISADEKISIGFIPDPDVKKDEVTGVGIPKPKASEYAKVYGINPSTELEIGSLESKDNLKCLQTILYFSDLERLAQKLRDDARSANEEKGIQTLHCMLGFLSWNDSKDSSKKINSPMLLAPVEIDVDKSAVNGQHFFISNQDSGDDVWIVNPSLKVKLMNDYGIELPLLEPEDSPTSYLGKVSKRLSVRPDWSIVQRFSIGNVAFPRLALYEDLDPKNWDHENGNSLFEHPVLNQLITGKTREPSDLSVMEVEEGITPSLIEGLIFDADSSQLEAIRRVLKGETMVLEGPPGTGKSQTIANLIATYLARGKKVLFVAEKRAAIEVVEQRLAKVGLGEFCLNLHNDSRQSKEALYEKLRKRLELPKARYKDSIINETYPNLNSKVSSLATSLNKYYESLDLRPPGSHTNIGDLLWTSLHTRHEYDNLQNTIKNIHLPAALSINQIDLETTKGLLKNLEKAFIGLNTTPESIQDHPLKAIKNKHFDPFQFEHINQCFTIIGEKIEHLINSMRTYQEVADYESLTLNDCLNLNAIFPIENKLIPDDLYQQLMNHKNPLKIAQTLESLVENFPKCVESSNPLEFLKESQDILQRKLEYLKTSTAKKYGTACENAVAPLNQLILELTQFKTLIEQFFPSIYENESCDLQSCASELRLILKISTSIKEELNPFINSELSHADLDWNQIKSLATRYKQRDVLRKELADFFLQDFVDDHAQINEFANSLLPAGFFRKFTRSWRIQYNKLSSKVASDQKLDRSTVLNFLIKSKALSDETQLIEQKKHDLGLVTESLTINTNALENLLKAHEIKLHLRNDGPTLFPLLINSRQNLLESLNAINNSFNDNPVNILEKLIDFFSVSNRIFIENTIQNTKNELDRIENLLEDLHEFNLNDQDSNATINSYILSLGNILLSEELIELLSSWTIVEVIDCAKTIDSILSKVSSDKQKKLICTISPSNFKHVNTSIKLAEELSSKISELFENNFLDPEQLSFEGLSTLSLKELDKWQKYTFKELPKMEYWHQFHQILFQLAHNKSPAFVFIQSLLDSHIPLVNLTKTFTIILDQSKIKQAIQNSASRNITSGNELERLNHEFKLFDKKAIDEAQQWTRYAVLSRDISPGSRSIRKRDWTGLHLVIHELGKQKRRIGPRKLINRALTSLLDLTPCFMMSPLNAAQYLQTSHNPIFDLVLIDEASQMKPEEAFSAIARGSQLVVVGDSKQLPPTSFFGAQIDDEDVEDDDAVDNESILDMAKTIFSSHSLRWHYRSKHDSLIYFSNQQFYGGRLVVCPSSKEMSDMVGVHLIQANGIYNNGDNIEEANITIEQAINTIKKTPFQSLGIVAMNRQQKELLQSFLYKAACTDEDVKAYLDYWEEKKERCFVKNLENVQGDERDIILISTVYGPSEKGGKVLRRFGPINSRHGHRRLNVLCTRARSCMYVVTSLKPSDVLPSDSTPASKGVESFSKFLEYAGSGQRLTHAPSEEPESPFEEFVGDFLSNAGYEVYYQIGQSGFRIDIGIKHPSYPYGFIAGIECDGAAYHSHRSARDRDRLRQEILENHGWKIYRIWSTDWFHHPKQEQEKLLNWLSKLISEFCEQNSIDDPINHLAKTQ